MDFIFVMLMFAGLIFLAFINPIAWVGVILFAGAVYFLRTADQADEVAQQSGADSRTWGALSIVLGFIGLVFLCGVMVVIVEMLPTPTP